jgi:hypothetical protein
VDAKTKQKTESQNENFRNIGIERILKYLSKEQESILQKKVSLQKDYLNL